MPVSTALERKKAIFCLFSACFKISIVLGKLKAPPFEKIPAARRDFFALLSKRPAFISGAFFKILLSGCRLIAALANQGFVVINPILHVNFAVGVVRITHDDVFNAGVDNHSFAHGATVGILDILVGGYFPPGQIQRGAQHFVARGADDGVGFGMYAAAQFVALAAGNV